MAERRKIYTAGADQVVVKSSPKLDVTVHVVLPAPMRGFKDVDPSDVDVKALLSRIAREHDSMVEAEANDSGVTVTVSACNRTKAQDVITVIRGHLKYQPGEEGVWRTRLLVHPPSDGKSCFTAVLQPKEGTTGRRVIAAEPEGLKPNDPDDIVSLELEYRSQFAQAINRTGRILLSNPNGMRMRVQFGTLVLDEWKKDKTEYSFAELCGLVHRVGTRGTAHMVNRVSKKAIQALRDSLSPSNGDLPESVRSYLGLEPMQTDSLILKTKNLSVESTFEKMQGQGKYEGKTGDVLQYTLGPLTTQQQEKQQRALEIATACPEGAHDWVLEIRKGLFDQDTEAVPPFTVQQLEKSLKFRRGALAEDFPEIAVTKHFLSNHDIENIYAKTTWSYTLSAKYLLEINLFHEFRQKTPNQNVTVSTAATTGSVALYSQEWDNDMRAGAAVPRQWEPCFAKQFLMPYDGDKAPGENHDQTSEPLDHFLLWVKWIRTVLDDASAQDAEPSGGM
ncbi:hypothetical protein C8A03DRAFT_13020 [Achaetomium macrosporum]|uniref:DUF7905 domain-containing protein n=1 Tax=Achaetomium macrosporum TaxID=79813 RepID=A0AAN7CER8_9PEZI|nr:hypothetical protein C8A03DRAFT_13020 [Achaetomium macrosporum]